MPLMGSVQLSNTAYDFLQREDFVHLKHFCPHFEIPLLLLSGLKVYFAIGPSCWLSCQLLKLMIKNNASIHSQFLYENLDYKICLIRIISDAHIT